MRILMTGFAARGIGSTRTRYDITSLPAIIASALREMGHDVDGPRRVPLSEDVSGYDAVLVQVGWISSLSSSYAHEAARVMADSRGRVLRYVDDWRSQWLADDIAGHALSEKGWSKHVGNFRRKEYSGISDLDRARIRTEILRPIEDDSPLLVPWMPWGDLSLFDVSTKARLSATLIGWDPQSLSPVTPTRWPEDRDRQRRWVVASLQDHDRWVAAQGLTWPVLRLGGVKKNPGGTVIAGSNQVVIPESEVCQLYAESWGVLSPQYDSAGSGYWRTRWEQAMEAGSIIWPGPIDAAQIGGAFEGLTPQAIEEKTIGGLSELARAQAERLDSFKWTAPQALEALDAVVEGVRAGVPYSSLEGALQ